MNLRTSLRASGVRWAAPFALALSLLYYFANGGPPSTAWEWPPTLTSATLRTVYAPTYVVAVGLAVWESGRLRQSGVWTLAPARSRWRVAAQALAPVLVLVWSMPALPVVLALADAGVLPDLASLRLLGMAWAVGAGYLVLGFAVGLRGPRVVTAPLAMVLVWVLVAFSWSVDPPWLRHVSGQYPTYLMFGELASLGSLAPHVLFTGGLAAGVALLWLPARSALPRIALAFLVAVCGPLAAYRIAADWDYNPPLLAGQAPMACLGSAPRVCVPQVAAADLPAIRKDAVTVLNELRAAGVDVAPEVITDRLPDGRYGRPSTDRTWRVGLTAAARRGDVGYQVLRAAVDFPCPRGDTTRAHTVLLWAATVTGEEPAYRARLAGERAPVAGDAAARETVREVRELPVAQQGAWFRHNLDAVCDRGA